MRLGVVGLVPGDPRAITPGHLEKVRALGLTAACYHGSTPELFEITREDCERANRLYREEQMDLAQFGIGYGQCLFDPDKETRRQALRIIHRGLEVAAMLRAQHALIRTGSLSPEGSYAPSTENYRPGRMEQLVETLREIAV
jgi:sugar phosphate isomerase/epimerase